MGGTKTPENKVFEDARKVGDQIFHSFKDTGELPHKTVIQFVMRMSPRQLKERWDLALVFFEKQAYSYSEQNGGDLGDRALKAVKAVLGESYSRFEIVRGREQAEAKKEDQKASETGQGA